jgi:hypothetical protein
MIHTPGLFLNLGPTARYMARSLLQTIGVLAVSCQLCFAQAATQEFAEDPAYIPDGKVEIDYPPSLLEPYRERRSDWSFQFATNLENFRPNEFISSNDGLTYDQLFGSSSVPVLQLSLGSKYNLAIGALTVNFIGGYGKVSGDRSGVSRELEITKKALTAEWILDAIMHEPYVAPYIQGQILEIEYRDKGAAVGDSSGRTALTSGYTLGLLIQLNFLDPTDTAMVANKNYGLNNTFIDIFASQYNTSQASDDPDFKTTLNWGAGLRLEF